MSNIDIRVNYVHFLSWLYLPGLGDSTCASCWRAAAARLRLRLWAQVWLSRWTCSGEGGGGGTGEPAGVCQTMGETNETGKKWVWGTQGRNEVSEELVGNE